MRRTNINLWLPFMNLNMMGIWKLPGKSMPIGNKQDLERIKFFNTKSREKWDYQGIDEKITSQSQFKDMSQRDSFDGPRPDHKVTYRASMDSNQPEYKRLHEHFDEYTKPGIDKKVAIAQSVKNTGMLMSSTTPVKLGNATVPPSAPSPKSSSTSNLGITGSIFSTT